MKRAIFTLGFLVACTAILLGCDSNDKPNPVDENVPDTEIKQGESVNPEDLDLFKDDQPKKDDSKGNDSTLNEATKESGSSDSDGGESGNVDLREPASQGPPIEQPKLKIPGGSGEN